VKILISFHPIYNSLFTPNTSIQTQLLSPFNKPTSTIKKMASRTFIRRFMKSATTYLAEAHPHQRLPLTTSAHPHDTKILFRHFARTATVFFPATFLLLASPAAVTAFYTKQGI